MKNRSTHAPPAPYRRNIGNTLLPFAVLVPCLAGLFYLEYHLREADAGLKPEVARLEAEWNSLSARSKEAEPLRQRYEVFLSQVQRIEKEDHAPGWTPVLRILTGLKNPGIEFRGVSVGGTGKGSWLLRVDGVTTGTAPRIVADGFRQALQREMETVFKLEAPCQFDRLAEESAPDSATASSPRAAFTLTATFTAKNP